MEPFDVNNYDPGATKKALRKFKDAAAGVANATKQLSYVDAQKQAATLLTGAVPESPKEALASEDRDYWRAAMDEEVDNLMTSKSLTDAVLDKVEWREALRTGKLRGTSVVGSKWVFAIKLLGNDDDTPLSSTVRINKLGQKVRYKARLVAKGFQQRASDYSETYAATPQITSIRVVLAMALLLGMQSSQLDVKAAFLQAHLPPEEQVFLLSPDAQKIYRLMRSLYGLKQAAYRWKEDIDSTLQKEGFENLDADTCIYTHRDGNGKIVCVIALHVDDSVLLDNESDDDS